MSREDPTVTWEMISVLRTIDAVRDALSLKPRSAEDALRWRQVKILVLIV
jgi:hypothetical protein